MKLFFDYSKGKVDTTNKKRIIFINRMAYLMQELNSTSDEVNELVNWLFCRSEGVPYHEPSIEINKDYKLMPITKLDDKRFIKEVYVCDFHIYSYALMLHDFDHWSSNDVLTDIIDKLYFKIDSIVHPYEEEYSGVDLEDIKYYVEFNYVDEEQ